MTAWIDFAREALVRQRSDETGWGYHPGGRAFVEPTALAGLALLAAAPRPGSIRVAREAAEWLAGIQRPDGALPLAAGIPAPCWGTPYAILLWAALDDYEPQRRAAAQWLLGVAGKTDPPDPTGVVSHDTSIAGWPWVENTHSWLEPTAMAVLAMRRQRHEAHPRVGEGIRLIRDRSAPGGAWNFGNPRIFGTTVPPQPAPTGMALLALAAADVETGLIEGACRYLRNGLRRVRTPRSLAWGLMGLDAWQERPPEGDAWLAESFAEVAGRGSSPAELAQLMLAASGRTLGLLGVDVLRRSPAP
ncbi:MAG: hypothetical protein ACYSWU_18155 [Planctomycetota bacterium]